MQNRASSLARSRFLNGFFTLSLLGAGLVAYQKYSDTAEPELPEEIKNSKEKQFWMDAVRKSSIHNKEGVYHLLAEAMDNSKVVVTDSRDDWDKVYTARNSEMSAVVVSPTHDTLAILDYQKEFVYFSPEYQRETGESSTTTEKFNIRFTENMDATQKNVKINTTSIAPLEP